MTLASRTVASTAGLTAAAIVAWTVSAHAQTPATPSVERIEFREFGIYVDKSTSQVPSVRTATGYVRKVVDEKLVEQTSVVCARIGTNFGLRFEPVGAPVGAAITLDWVTRFPAPGVVTANGTRMLDSRHSSAATIGAVSYRAYMFEFAWEIVPGEWSFEFYHQGRKVGEKTFTVLATCQIS